MSVAIFNQQSDDSGSPLNGGSVTIYLAGFRELVRRARDEIELKRIWPEGS